MCSAYVWPRSVQGQGHNLRLNIIWLYFVFALYLLNPWWDLQITLHKCQLWWDDVQCAVWPRLVQGQGKKLTLYTMLHMGYLSPSVIALVNDFTFFYKKNWFHPVTYGGRHDCFRFRKHPSSFFLLWFIKYHMCCDVCREGVIQPGRPGPDGRPVPVSHILELVENQPDIPANQPDAQQEDWTCAVTTEHVL